MGRSFYSSLKWSFHSRYSKFNQARKETRGASAVWASEISWNVSKRFRKQNNTVAIATPPHSPHFAFFLFISLQAFFLVMSSHAYLKIKSKQSHSIMREKLAKREFYWAIKRINPCVCFVISNFSCSLRKVWKSSHIHCVIFLRYDKLQTAQDCWIVVDTVSVSYKSIIFNYLMRSWERIWCGGWQRRGEQVMNVYWGILGTTSQIHSQKNTHNFPTHTRPFVASGPAWCDMQINLTERVSTFFLLSSSKNCRRHVWK